MKLPLEIYPSRTRAVIGLFTGLILLIVVAFAGRGVSVQIGYHFYMYAVFYGLPLLAVVAGLKGALFPRPQVVLYAEGFSYPKMGLSLLPWEDIQGTYLHEDVETEGRRYFSSSESDRRLDLLIAPDSPALQQIKRFYRMLLGRRDGCVVLPVGLMGSKISTRELQQMIDLLAGSPLQRDFISPFPETHLKRFIGKSRSKTNTLVMAAIAGAGIGIWLLKQYTPMQGRDMEGLKEIVLLHKWVLAGGMMVLLIPAYLFTRSVFDTLLASAPLFVLVLGLFFFTNACFDAPKTMSYLITAKHEQHGKFHLEGIDEQTERRVEFSATRGDFSQRQFNSMDLGENDYWMHVKEGEGFFDLRWRENIIGVFNHPVGARPEAQAAPRQTPTGGGATPSPEAGREVPTPATASASDACASTCVIDLLEETWSCDGAQLFDFVVPIQNNQAVIVISLPPEAPCRAVSFDVTYGESPDGWSLNIGDSITNNGYGGDGRTQSRDAEIQVLNRRLSVYGNDEMPGNERLLFHLDDVIGADGALNIIVSDEAVAIKTPDGARKRRSPYLFALNGQPDHEGDANYDVYAAFNRVIHSNARSGSGVNTVKISLLE